MPGKDLVNSNFKQQENVCVTASYATIIEFFSDEEVKVDALFRKYIKHFNIKEATKPSDKHFIKNRQGLIFKHLHDYCVPKNMRGLTFIEQMHTNNLLDTRRYCSVVRSRQSTERIGQDDINMIRTELVDNDALAMVLYKSGDNLSHAVVIGYDSEEQVFFCKDPERAEVHLEDILATREITEYLVFNFPPENQQNE